MAVGTDPALPQQNPFSQRSRKDLGLQEPSQAGEQFLSPRLVSPAVTSHVPTAPLVTRRRWHPPSCHRTPGVPTVTVPPPPSPGGDRGSLDGAERVGQPRGGWDGARWLRGTIGPLSHTLWHRVALSAPPGGGRAAVPALSGPSVVPSGAGGDWCGSRGRTSMSPAGEGTRTGRSAMDACGMRKNVGLLRMQENAAGVLLEPGVPKAVSPKPPPVRAVAGGSSGPLLGPYFHHPARAVGFVLPPKPSGVTPRCPSHLGGLMGGSPPQAPTLGGGRGWRELQPPPGRRGSGFPRKVPLEPPEEMAHC